MSNLSTPTADQLAAARLAHWHQNTDPILTINMLRDWLNISGLVFFTPRAAQIPAPAPSFVEAILGTANATPNLADTDQSRSLLSRLILDGGAIPLNLLGSPTGTGSETPDFIVSPLAFPYVFTLRGDKAWKQPPTTSGATKVSPLALNAYTLLSERAKDHATGMSSYDLTTQLGKEVTETAVLRSLTELWQHLRVIPVPQPDGAATLWELTTTRFTKQIKAGANAGQPTALSALISLYLGQAIVASEEDIETFLSPIAARSRIRDVIHALISARQLETIAVEGRTVLHVAGELPAFLEVATLASDDIDSLVVTTEGESIEATNETPRITKFVPKPRKVGTGFVTKPGRTSESTSASRERRPFTRESNRPDRPSFTKPWEEEKADRLAAAKSPPRFRTKAKPQKLPELRAPTIASPASIGQRSGRPSVRNHRSAQSPPSDRSHPSAADPVSAASPASVAIVPLPAATVPPSVAAQTLATAARHAVNILRAPTTTPQQEKATVRARPSPSQVPSGANVKAWQASQALAATAATPVHPAATPATLAPRAAISHLVLTQTRETLVLPVASLAINPASVPSLVSAARANPAASPPARNAALTVATAPTASRRAKPFPGTPKIAPAAERAAHVPRDHPSANSTHHARLVLKALSKPNPVVDSVRKAVQQDRQQLWSKKPYSKSSTGHAGKSTGGSFGAKKPYGKSSSIGTGKPASTFDKFKGNKKPFGNRPPARKFKREEGE
ncbi:hypothetical protein [Tunturiibacter gelidiferens]|uniref:hypothetical protein n=1 Tax=Tunturiibacter gelidiferens TaxID=3069689 RepID=UPI003D9B6894